MNVARCFAVASALALTSGAACHSSSSPSGGDAPRPEPTRTRYDFGYAMDDTLRVNHVQSKGTHNSYHVESPGNALPDWHYTRAPLDVQAESEGVRAFELDTHFIEEDGAFEVFHIATFDEGSTCHKLVDCLSTLKGWSDAHPGHVPLLVMIEPKDEPPPGAEEPYFAEMEKEILSVWPHDWIVKPDDLQGDSATLREGVLAHGWPTLRESRGTILFFVNNTDAFRAAYSRGGTSLKGRVMFTQAVDESDPLAAVFVLNDAVTDHDAIESAIGHGFLARTFSDGANSVSATVSQAAVVSGAHVVSTDYPVPVDAGTYSLVIPDGTPSRCNPVVAPAGCTSSAVEDPSRLAAP